MQITRLSRSPLTVLTSEELADWLRIDDDQDVSTIDMLVSSAVDQVEGLTGLCLSLSVFRVTLDGRSTRYRLPIAPVNAITKVEVRNCVGVLQEVTGWYSDGDHLAFTALPPSDPIVTLEAGFADPTAIPQSLRHAIAVQVSAGFNGREETSDQTAKTIDRLCQPHKRFAW